jgi:predicted dehydrogenase
VSRLNVGVVGAGNWGKNHVRTVAGLADAELAAVCETDPKRRERLAKQYPATHISGDLADFLSHVDAVVVASPAATHARIALQCIDAGKPCLIEKPLALNTQDAEAVAQRSAARKVPVLAGHLLLFHPAVEHLRTLVQSGEMGKVYYLYGLRSTSARCARTKTPSGALGPTMSRSRSTCWGGRRRFASRRRDAATSSPTWRT